MNHQKTFKAYICFQHKKYKALRKPRVLCEDCWRGWLNGFSRIHAQEMREKKKSENMKKLMGYRIPLGSGIDEKA